jgi:hypothetical protein
VPLSDAGREPKLKKRTAVTLLAFLCCASFLDSCANREIKEIRGMAIRSVDLSRVADGTYEGSFAYGSFSYVVSVLVEN